MRKIAISAAFVVLSMSAATATFAQASTQGPSGLRAGAAPTVLYDQTDGVVGFGSLSMKFLDPGFDLYDSQAADDFVVPAGHAWDVEGLDVIGSWVAGLRPRQAVDLAMNVTFYRGNRPGGLPGTVVATATDIPVDPWTNPRIAITLPAPVRLLPGTYWVSVQLNVTYLGVGGYWSWNTRAAQSGNPAAWRNPGAGFDPNCTRWSHATDCVYGQNLTGDHAFVLKGSVAW